MDYLLVMFSKESYSVQFVKVKTGDTGITSFDDAYGVLVRDGFASDANKLYPVRREIIMFPEGVEEREIDRFIFTGYCDLGDYSDVNSFTVYDISDMIRENASYFATMLDSMSVLSRKGKLPFEIKEFYGVLLSELSV